MGGKLGFFGGPPRYGGYIGGNGGPLKWGAVLELCFCMAKLPKLTSITDLCHFKYIKESTTSFHEYRVII